MPLTHSPLEILPKTHFEPSQAVFWSLSCCKELNLTIKPLTGHTLRGLLIQVQNISVGSSGMRRAKFLLPSFFHLLPPFFFFYRVFSWLHFGEKRF